MSSWPTVTVQLPIFNEPHVVQRLLDAVASLDYAHELIEVQVLDDSTDDTFAQVAARVAELSAGGLNIVHVNRRDRQGYKAGALAAGLRRAHGEFICIFDADFVPPSDFLKRVLPHFDAPDIGMVQARWDHLNRDYSLLTKIQALLLDAHFAVEQAARHGSGRFFNFNGTAGIWRRAAIEQAGGWQHDTLTEDLDLSYRAQLCGWRFCYVDCPAAPAELPVSIMAFKTQQHRWTKGAVQTARKLLRRLWTSPVPLRVKLEATFHMTANFAYPLMIALSVLVVPTMVVRQARGLWWFTWLDVPILLFASGSASVFFLLAQHEVGRIWWREVVRLPALMALGIGISLNNTVAVVQGMCGPPGEFVRTPKHAVVHVGQRWNPAALGVRAGWLVIVETGCALYFTAAAVLAVVLGLWTFLPFVMLFQAGYSYTAALSLAEYFGHRPAADRQTP